MQKTFFSTSDWLRDDCPRRSLVGDKSRRRASAWLLVWGPPLGEHILNRLDLSADRSRSSRAVGQAVRPTPFRLRSGRRSASAQSMSCRRGASCDPSPAGGDWRVRGSFQAHLIGPTMYIPDTRLRGVDRRRRVSPSPLPRSLPSARNWIDRHGAEVALVHQITQRSRSLLLTEGVLVKHSAHSEQSAPLAGFPWRAPAISDTPGTPIEIMTERIAPTIISLNMEPHRRRCFMSRLSVRASTNRLTPEGSARGVQNRTPAAWRSGRFARNLFYLRVRFAAGRPGRTGPVSSARCSSNSTVRSIADRWSFRRLTSL